MITPEEEALMRLLLRMYSGTRVVKGGMNSAISQGNLNPLSDNAYSLGTSSLRWANVVGNNFNVYHAAGDANPTAQLTDGALNFGAGGSSLPDITFMRTALQSGPGGLFKQNGQYHAIFAFGPTNTNTGNLYFFYRNNSYNTNDEAILISSDLVASGTYFFGPFSGGTGAIHPLLFGMFSSGVYTETFRVTTDPYVLFQGFGFDNAAISANTTLTAASKTVQLATGGAGGITVTLPAANAGKRLFIIIKADSGAGAVTVAAAGTDTIQGSATKSLSTQYSKIMLQSDGTSTWYDLSSGLV